MPDSTTADPVAFPGAGGITLAADRWDPPSGTPSNGTVLLLHGGGQTRHSWRTTGRALAGAGWSTYALDARGHGDSGWAADGDYSMDALVADLRAVVTALDVQPVLVGASLGGSTALLAEGEGCGLARGIVLVDVTPRIEPEGVAEIMAFMRSGLGGFASLEDAADAVAAYNPHRPRPASTDGLRKNLRLREGRWYWHWDPRFVDGRDEPSRERPDDEHRSRRAREAARRISVPTLLVRGVRSRVVSEASAAELRALIPHSEQIDVSGAGHMVAGDDNDVFSGGLRRFLEERVAALPSALRH
ncbi:alpha/beta fold hydrolase [Pseudonocardia acidicola]|uniref:Alpha/beta hydrolase n=1 Tax=Pseudonocardia acidicola TaxID=2724939 RepID=A0ABX1S9F2_9PSEU|nr:alpha/beta hydrolase [Pseudonocardia acidicola]NMH98196.1 alpha/beta hydrolase [Pseudonocardia acidicola]